jgi:hypothetical protein
MQAGGLQETESLQSLYLFFNLSSQYLSYTPPPIVSILPICYLQNWVSLFFPHYASRPLQNIPQYTIMDYTFTHSALPSTLFQTRLQVHTLTYTILYASPIVQIFIFHRIYTSLLHYINSQTLVFSSLYYQFPTQLIHSPLPILASNHHSISNLVG